MSKELENLLEDLDSGIEVKTKYGLCYAFSPDVIEAVKKVLHRLEAIDNANPSKALECLERIDNTLCLNNIKSKLDFGIDTEEHTDCDSVIGMTEDLEYIKQALLKAQEPKHYLKWKDLKFTKKTKEMLVKLGDTTYPMQYYKVNDHTNKVCISSFQFIEIYDIRFFNDLHLERVE